MFSESNRIDGKIDEHFRVCNQIQKCNHFLFIQKWSSTGNHFQMTISYLLMILICKFFWKKAIIYFKLISFDFNIDALFFIHIQRHLQFNYIQCTVQFCIYNNSILQNRQKREKKNGKFSTVFSSVIVALLLCKTHLTQCYCDENID